MSVMTVERDVAAPPERVWGIVTDLEHAADVISGITALERTDGGAGFGVGTAWRETRVMFGREATETMEVTAVEEGRSYTVESASRGVLYTTVMRVEPKGDGSRLAWDFSAEARSASAKLMSLLARLFEGRLRKDMLQDLDDIAAAAEAGAAGDAAPSGDDSTTT